MAPMPPKWEVMLFAFFLTVLVACLFVIASYGK